jgi:hypothetical protein
MNCTVNSALPSGPLCNAAVWPQSASTIRITIDNSSLCRHQKSAPMRAKRASSKAAYGPNGRRSSPATMSDYEGTSCHVVAAQGDVLRRRAKSQGRPFTVAAGLSCSVGLVAQQFNAERVPTAVHSQAGGIVPTGSSNGRGATRKASSRRPRLAWPVVRSGCRRASPGVAGAPSLPDKTLTGNSER